MFFVCRFPGNKRIWSSSRFGDLSVLDFETPQQVTRNFSLVKEIVNQLRNKNKNLFRQNKRLRAKVSSLNHTLTDLKKKSLTEITANNLEVQHCLSLNTISSCIFILLLALSFFFGYILKLLIKKCFIQLNVITDLLPRIFYHSLNKGIINLIV